MIEQYGYHEFEIFEYPDDDYPDTKYYYYKIYTEGCKPYDDGVIESVNMYDFKEDAKLAAIAHIDLLENGES